MLVSSSQQHPYIQDNAVADAEREARTDPGTTAKPVASGTGASATHVATWLQ